MSSSVVSVPGHVRGQHPDRERAQTLLGREPIRDGHPDVTAEGGGGKVPGWTRWGAHPNGDSHITLLARSATIVTTDHEEIAKRCVPLELGVNGEGLTGAVQGITGAFKRTPF